jgi:C4-dicarboxylate-specific signal transduction histidine kinase
MVFCWGSNNQAYGKSLEDKQPYEIKHRLLMDDGRIKWVIEKCQTTFDSDGKPLVSTGIVFDITKEYLFQQQQDELILQQQKLSSLGEMIGNIAHQWRQPLTLISTLSTGTIFQKEMGSLDDKILVKNMENINDNAQYLSNTIDTFRDFIKDKKEVKEVVLQKSIHSALTIIETSLKNNNIQLNTQINNDKEIKMIMPSGELSQVIINIVNNAKDILIEKKVEQPWIELNLFEENNKVIISIEDNGGGVPESIIEKIFEPYFTTKHQSQGTGLGLHMSYRIVTESLDGELYVQNTQNGAKFYIVLPFCI